MAITTPNMGLMTWDQLGDFFSHTDLRGNFVALDAHDHTPTKGVQVPGAGIASGAIGTVHLQDGAVTKVKIGTGQVSFDRLDSTVTPLLWQVGDVKLSALSAAPAGWVLCDGSPVSRTSFSVLFNAIGTTWGTGDGSTTFNVPDLRGRSPIGLGQGSGLANRVLAAKGGEETHVSTIGEMPSHTHTQNAHNHGITDSGHAHSPGSGGAFMTSGGQNLVNLGGSTDGRGTDVNTTVNGTGIGINNATATSQNSGGGAAHNNMQPFAVLNFIIKT